MITFVMPMRMENLANKREHWAAKAKRAKSQRQTAFIYARAGIGINTKPPFGMIKITRVGKRRMDSDGLAISGKHVRDGIADALEIDDGDPCFHWAYDQRIGKEYGVEVEIS